MTLLPRNQFRLPERRHVANVFVDLCGSTAAGEQLPDTRDLFDLLDRWQRLTAFLFCNYGGRIGASDSDMVMGYFAGSETENFALSRAMLAANGIREKTLEFASEIGLALNVHIGLHCGEVEVGNIGPEIRGNLTTVGPTVNIAARLESKAGQGEIFASGQLATAAKIRWSGDYVGACPLKGVSQPVDCYRLGSVGLFPNSDDQLIESEWVAAVIEAEALIETGRNAEAVKLAQRARNSSAPIGLARELYLLPQEICIRGLLSLRKPTDAARHINEFALDAEKLSLLRHRARASFYLGQCSMEQLDFGAAVTAFDDARERFGKHGSGRDIADSLYYAGVGFDRLGDSRKAGNFFAAAEKRYLHFIDSQESDPAEIGKACLELSLLLDAEPARAIEVLARAQRIFHETCQFRHLVSALLNMSCVANRMLLFTDAENYARRALALARDFDPVEGVGLALGNIGAALENRSDAQSLEQAKRQYQEALSVAITSGDLDRCEELSARIRRLEAKLKESL